MNRKNDSSLGGPSDFISLLEENRYVDDKWVVITGALGFIGSSIVRYLNDVGYDRTLVLVDDFKESSKWKNLIGKRYGEFLSRHELMRWLKGRGDEVGAFVHMGANSSTVGTDGDDYYRTNYRFSVDLATFAIEEECRFIYASSAATYGNAEQGFEDDPTTIDALRPMNLYGQSKQMFDQWVIRNKYLNKVVGLKFFNVYGPNEAHKGRMASMVYHLFHQIQKEGKVRLFKSNAKEFSDGGQMRDFIYSKDVAKIVFELLCSDITGIYNIGTGSPRSWNELATIIFKALDRAPSIEYIPMPVELMHSYQNYTAAKMHRLSSQLPLPTTSLEEGASDYVKNYLLSGALW